MLWLSARPMPRSTFAPCCVVASPMTRAPGWACCQIRAISATVRHLPVPAGPTST